MQYNNDIPKIAEIHVKSWQTTYQGIISSGLFGWFKYRGAGRELEKQVT